MSKSTYISENLTKPQIEFMLKLDELELDIFTLPELKDQLKGNKEDINEILENLVNKRILSRIEKGKYCRSNFRDDKVIGCYLAKDAAISYWSALNLHGLTEQFPNLVFIQTTIKKAPKEVFGVSYKFIRISKNKRTGITREGYGNYSYNITDIEKTIADCFDLPQYTGGYAELIRAFANANLTGEKIIEYGKALNNRAAVKRMGYLAELINKKGMKPFIRFAKDQVTETYNPFDPMGPDTGSFNAEWRLRLNIPENKIREIINNQY